MTDDWSLVSRRWRRSRRWAWAQAWACGDLLVGTGWYWCGGEGFQAARPGCWVRMFRAGPGGSSNNEPINYVSASVRPVRSLPKHPACARTAPPALAPTWLLAA